MSIAKHRHPQAGTGFDGLALHEALLHKDTQAVPHKSEKRWKNHQRRTFLEVSNQCIYTPDRHQEVSMNSLLQVIRGVQKRQGEWKVLVFAHGDLR